MHIFFSFEILQRQLHKLFFKLLVEEYVELKKILIQYRKKKRKRHLFTVSLSDK